ncbi:MAG: M42 family metallopeptidase [Promethearchaeota archaeon]
MNNKEILTVITKLASQRAPSGLEKARSEVFKKELETIFKEKDIPVNKDLLGNYYVKLKGKSGKLSIAILAHIDEIGGTIRKIKKKGTLEFSRRGGYEGRWLVSRTIEILNKEGNWIKGIISGRSAHSTPDRLRTKEKLDPLEMEIYIGAKSKEEAIKDYKIHVGSPFVFSGDFGLLNPEINDNLIAGYSMDNLAALTCLIVLAEKIKNQLMDDFGHVKLSHDVYIVGTTREEIGTEGAYYFLKHNNMDRVIGIDIGLVADFSGSVNSDIQLEGGPVIIWQEGRGHGVLDHGFCKNLSDIAEKKNIPFQNGVCEFYGSDAGKAQKWLGVPSALIGIPVMYSHNVPEISTLSGIDKAAELIIEYLKSLK